MINKRILLAALTAIGLGSVTAGAALAQAYPTRPIRIIVPFLAGGTVDIVARQIGQQLSALLGQPVVIDKIARDGGTSSGRCSHTPTVRRTARQRQRTPASPPAAEARVPRALGGRPVV